MRRLEIIHERLLDWGIWRRHGFVYKKPTGFVYLNEDMVTLNGVESTAAQLHRITQTDRAVAQLSKDLLICVVGVYMLNVDKWRLAAKVGIGQAAVHRRLCVADRQLLGYLDVE